MANEETSVASSLPDDIRESVAVGNIKTIGEAGSFAMGLAFQNQVAHQNRVNILAENALAQAIKGMQEVDPLEALSTVKALSGNDLAQQIATLTSALASNQQGAKVAQTTPPVTA